MSKILAVDDEQLITDIIREMLERIGHKVVVANNGIEAVEITKQQEFDLFITDISMPKMDGYKLINEILTIQPLAIIVVLTGYSSVEGAIKAIRSGAFKYLMKPIRSKELYQVVEEGLEKSAKNSSPFVETDGMIDGAIVQNEPVVFKNFSAEQKLDFMDVGEPCSLEMGEQLDNEAINTKGFYLIAEGEVSVWLNNKKIDFLRKNDTWGEGSFLLFEQLTVSLRAEANTSLFFFDRKKLMAFFSKRSESILKRFILNISSAIHLKYRKSAQRIMMMQIGKNS